ncbi:unnamed protein product [Gongylonema pulchrum]|uniref:ACB domain-containing protein n=1 Tax=Gongylonema pulchrum TaxID=637853 RepID=A0A183EQD7_9BILA|nr:unnamed protein product [Gongylonema pulchrum]
MPKKFLFQGGGQRMNFEEAAEKVKRLKQRPTDDEMLELYGLYKQATMGDNTTSKPSMPKEFLFQGGGQRMNFEEAAEKVKHLKQRPTDDEMLELYGLYKQATMGDNTTSKPWMIDMKGRMKWDAWEKRKGFAFFLIFVFFYFFLIFLWFLYFFCIFLLIPNL